MGVRQSQLMCRTGWEKRIPESSKATAVRKDRRRSNRKHKNPVLGRHRQRGISNVSAAARIDPCINAYADDRQYGLMRSKEYLSALETDAKNGEYPLFSEAIEKILRYGVTIEQEVFLNE